MNKLYLSNYKDISPYFTNTDNNFFEIMQLIESKFDILNCLLNVTLVKNIIIKYIFYSYMLYRLNIATQK